MNNQEFKNPHEDKFIKIMDMLNSSDRYDIIDVYRIIKTFEDRITLKDLIDMYNKYNIITNEIRSSNKMTDKEIDEFIELSKEKKL